MDLKQEQETVDKLADRLKLLRGTIDREQDALDTATQRVKNAEDAQEILQLVSKATQQKAHEKICGVVSNCLEAVFGKEAYKFQINFEMKRGRTEATLRFLRGELDVDPISASGGGAVDVAAFALRAACLVLHRPRLSPVLVLDEPFRFVSAEYQDKIRMMLEEMSEDLDVQIVMITHNEAYETGKIIRL